MGIRFASIATTPSPFLSIPIHSEPFLPTSLHSKPHYSSHSMVVSILYSENEGQAYLARHRLNEFLSPKSTPRSFNPRKFYRSLPPTVLIERRNRPNAHPLLHYYWLMYPNVKFSIPMGVKVTIHMDMKVPLGTQVYTGPLYPGITPYELLCIRLGFQQPNFYGMFLNKQPYFGMRLDENDYLDPIDWIPLLSTLQQEFPRIRYNSHAEHAASLVSLLYIFGPPWTYEYGMKLYTPCQFNGMISEGTEKERVLMEKFYTLTTRVNGLGVYKEPMYSNLYDNSGTFFELSQYQQGYQLTLRALSFEGSNALRQNDEVYFTVTGLITSQHTRSYFRNARGLDLFWNIQTCFPIENTNLFQCHDENFYVWYQPFVSLFMNANPHFRRFLQVKGFLGASEIEYTHLAPSKLLTSEDFLMSCFTVMHLDAERLEQIQILLIQHVFAEDEIGSFFEVCVQGIKNWWLYQHEDHSKEDNHNFLALLKPIQAMEISILLRWFEIYKVWYYSHHDTICDLFEKLERQDSKQIQIQTFRLLNEEYDAELFCNPHIPIHSHYF